MTATVEEARDQISDLFLETWENAPATAGIRLADGAVLFWNNPGVPPTALDANGNPPSWIRVAVQHLEGGQSALADPTGRLLVTRRGTVMISMYVAFKTGGGALLDKLLRIGEQAFQGKTTPGGIFFQRVRSRELGPSGVYFRSDIWADFQYDDVLNS